MTIPVLTFFNNKGGVGKTSLVYHLSWMLSLVGEKVLVCDLDPQANLTALFLEEDELESLWTDGSNNSTIYQCLKPLTQVGDLTEPRIRFKSEALGLIPGDLALSSFEDFLSNEWSKALEEQNLYRSFRILTAFWQVMQKCASKMSATIVLVDVGPNLGALNRSALIATDFVVAPLNADLFSAQGLRNLGPTLSNWRSGWSKRRDGWQSPNFALPEGAMRPIGYIVQQYGVYGRKPVRAFEKWVNRMPEIYARYLLEADGPFPDAPSRDNNCLATVKHYRSLVPMAQEAKKPVFLLTSADGAIGAHSSAANTAYEDFRVLSDLIQKRIKDPK